VTRRGALVRSGTVDRLTPAGWEALRAHGVRTIIDLRNVDERADALGAPAGVEVIHVSLDRLEEDPEFWHDWMNGPQFATPLYYRPFMERFPDRIERVLDAVEQAQPGGVLFHCVGGRDRTGLVAIVLLAIAGVRADVIADDYALGAERAHTHDPTFEAFLGEKGTSSRELVIDLVGSLDYDRPGLRARLVV
jgi:protein-tyrosine phosphatase